MKSKIKVCLCGIQGYVGKELISLVSQHPYLEVAAILAKKTQQALYAEIPTLAKQQIPVFSLLELQNQLSSIDVLLLATPVEESIEIVALLKDKPIIIIDLSGAFRLPKAQLNSWYGIMHEITKFATGAHYGLSPWSINQLQPITLIANPGCYATCALMALIPLLKSGVINSQNIIIDAKSGVSGAGKKLNADLMFCEMLGDFFPYKIGRHQHIPEIVNAVQQFTHTSVELTFTTHMLPIPRGISMSIYAEANLENEAAIKTEIKAAYSAAYNNYPLLNFAEIGETNSEMEKYLLSVKNVVGTAMTHIMYFVKGKKIVIFASIDNLLKGAASQAIENINALYHLPIETGLTKGNYL